MLTRKKIRIQLTSISQQEKYSISKQLQNIAINVQAHVIMVNSTGSVIHEVKSPLELIPTNDFQESFQLTCKGQFWGMLIIKNKHLTFLDRVFLEMQSSIISMYLQ